MTYDAIVVGGGIAGLTAAAYLGRAGLKALLCEQSDHLGGLVVSFDRDGFVFDGGIRAFENSGIVKPMLKQLGIDAEFIKSPVSVGIGKDFAFLGSPESIRDYETLLAKRFPEEKENIGKIIAEIKKVMGYMDVLYGIENPLFLDSMTSPGYVFKTLLPWLFKYKKNIRQASKLTDPINDHLARFTANRSLIDMITQHFFRATPAFFALSYFSLYLDYNYPLGGTGELVHKIEDYVRGRGVDVMTKTRVVSLDPARHEIRTAAGETFGYGSLVWAADMRSMYDALPTTGMPKAVDERRKMLVGKTGGDSVFTVYLEADVPPAAFASVCGAHSFYTPSPAGLAGRTSDQIDATATDAFDLPDGLAEYFAKTTYEISIPVLRDAHLAPSGKTGLIVSTLMDYGLVARIAAAGHYEAFKKHCERLTLDALVGGAFAILEGKIEGVFSSTPLTIERDTGNREGAITGWAFTNRPMPVESGFASIKKSVETPLCDVFQAGQWTFSPAGLPVSVLTGKLAADAAAKVGRHR